MAEITITLDPNEPDDRDAITTIVNWYDFYYPIWELSHNFNRTFKHKDWNEDQWKAFKEVEGWLMVNFEKPIKLIED